MLAVTSKTGFCNSFISGILSVTHTRYLLSEWKVLSALNFNFSMHNSDTHWLFCVGLYTKLKNGFLRWNEFPSLIAKQKTSWKTISLRKPLLAH